ncbi:hypothetical protein GOV03_03025 [Candidatus Woesearchaeota archaeon]|nr:hypothetical protein [Candidatus Woesearchaeota archaeon]
MTTFLKKNTELKTEGLDLDQITKLEADITYLDNHVHFEMPNSFMVADKFEATLVHGGIVEITPVKGPLQYPFFYSEGRDGIESVLDVEITEGFYKVGLRDGNTDNSFQRYILRKNPK